jgi:hypothetical protein
MTGGGDESGEELSGSVSRRCGCRGRGVVKTKLGGEDGQGSAVPVFMWRLGLRLGSIADVGRELSGTVWACSSMPVVCRGCEMLPTAPDPGGELGR